MRGLPSGLQDHLDSGTTTLCWCWLVTRKDGRRLGFTDHDNDLTFAGNTYEAASGFTATEARQAIGLNVDNSDVDGALQSDRITPDDLASGVYDDARVNLYRVNWQAPDQHILMRTGTIGEVTRTETTFRAEIRGLTHYLGQQQGRIYQSTCDADLGDAKCRVNLNTSSHRVSGSVITVYSPSRFRIAGLSGLSSGWFSFGRLEWTSGENSGRSAQIKRHVLASGAHTVELWESVRSTVEVGDTLRLTVGCNKLFSTCVTKFGNGVNFRGFPHLPNTSYVTFYPNSDDPR